MWQASPINLLNLSQSNTRKDGIYYVNIIAIVVVSHMYEIDTDLNKHVTITIESRTQKTECSHTLF